jgi:hypothetical protein
MRMRSTRCNFLEVLLIDQELEDGEGCALGAAAGRAPFAFYVYLFMLVSMYCILQLQVSRSGLADSACPWMSTGGAQDADQNIAVSINVVCVVYDIYS